MAAMTRLNFNIGPYGNFTFLSFFLKPQNRFEPSHVEFPIYTKNTNLVEDHPMNIDGKFSGFRERRVKCEKLTDGWTLTHDKSSHGLWPGELKNQRF
jgi:hypothetical protein